MNYLKLTPFWSAVISIICSICASTLCIETVRADTTEIYRDESVSLLKQYEGKTIRNIRIIVKDIFEEPVRNSFYRMANNAHINTDKKVIQRELLFKEGEPFSVFKLKETERILRQIRWQRNPDIKVTAVGESEVDIDVITQETWTFIPTVSYSSGDGSGNKSIGITEGDLLGLGKRVELLVADSSNRRTVEGVYDDWRVLDSDLRFVIADFYRQDGNRVQGFLSHPFRSLLDDSSWTIDWDKGDTVGKLWSGADERFIYRQNVVDLGASYSISEGPRESQHRYSLGLDYQDYKFSMPTAQDFDEANVDPKSVSQDPSLLAVNRKYIGPSLGYQALSPRFLKMAYIDRFDRPDDYDIGDNFSLNGTAALDTLGSTKNALLFSINRTGGAQFSKTKFIRGEFGMSGRYSEDGLENGLLRAQSTFYDVLGSIYVKDLFLGYHTLAFSYTFDIGHNLDKDREFLLGADEGLRGYDAKTFTGDKRFIMNFEDRSVLKEDIAELFSLGAAEFIDIGGSTSESLGSLFKDDLYADIGVGLRLAFPRSAGGKVLRMDFAVPFRDGPDGTNGYEIRIIFASGQDFSSKLRSEIVGAEKANVQIGTDR